MILILYHVMYLQKWSGQITRLCINVADEDLEEPDGESLSAHDEQSDYDVEEPLPDEDVQSVSGAEEFSSTADVEESFPTSDVDGCVPTDDEAVSSKRFKQFKILRSGSHISCHAHCPRMWFSK